MKKKKLVYLLLLAVLLNLFFMTVANYAIDEDEQITLFYHPVTGEVISFQRDGWDHMAETVVKGHYDTNDTDVVDVTPGGETMVYYRTSREYGSIDFYPKNSASESEASALSREPTATQSTVRPPDSTGVNDFSFGTRTVQKRGDGKYYGFTDNFYYDDNDPFTMITVHAGDDVRFHTGDSVTGKIDGINLMFTDSMRAAMSTAEYGGYIKFNPQLFAYANNDYSWNGRRVDAGHPLEYYKSAADVRASKFGWSEKAREAMISRFTQKPIEIPPPPKKPNLVFDSITTNYTEAVFKSNTETEFKTTVTYKLVLENGATWPNNIADIPVDFYFNRNGIETKTTRKFHSSSISKVNPKISFEFKWSAPYGYGENISFRSKINDSVNGAYKVVEKTWGDNEGFYGPIVLPEADPIPPGFFFTTVDNNKTVVNGAMTDMITAANKPITDENKNRYLPGSEVAVKITLDPAGVQYSRYLVKVNLNSKNNTKIKIVGNISSSMNGTENPAILQGEILNPPTTPFEVYYVFRFIKIDPKTPLADVEKVFFNQAYITPIKADGTSAESLNPELELKIRDALVNLM